VSGTTGIAWTTVEDAIQAWVVAGSGLASDHVVWADQPGQSGAPRPPRPAGAFIEMSLAVAPAQGYDWYDRELNVVTLAPIAVTAVNVGASALTAPGHGLSTGEGPLNVASTGSPPSPIAVDESVWPIVVDANTVKMAASFADAMASSPVPIALGGAGSGTITIVGTASTTVAGQEVAQRLRGPRVATLELTAFAGTGGTGSGPTSPTASLDGVVTGARLESVKAGLVTAGVAVAAWERIRPIGGVVNATEFEPRAFTTVTLNLASEVLETSTYIETVNATGTIGTATVDIEASS
jgi:hypothetical protein